MAYCPCLGRLCRTYALFFGAPVFHPSWTKGGLRTWSRSAVPIHGAFAHALVPAQGAPADQWVEHRFGLCRRRIDQLHHRSTVTGNRVEGGFESL